MRFVKKEVGYLDGIMVLLLAIAGNLGVQLLAGIIVGAGPTRLHDYISARVCGCARNLLLG